MFARGVQVSKDQYTIEPDGSITFPEPVSDKVRAKAYEEAARQRAAATDVDPEEAAVLARQSAGMGADLREKATEVQP